MGNTKAVIPELDNMTTQKFREYASRNIEKTLKRLDLLERQVVSQQKIILDQRRQLSGVDDDIRRMSLGKQPWRLLVDQNGGASEEE